MKDGFWEPLESFGTYIGEQFGVAEIHGVDQTDLAQGFYNLRDGVFHEIYNIFDEGKFENSYTSQALDHFGGFAKDFIENGDILDSFNTSMEWGVGKFEDLGNWWNNSTPEERANGIGNFAGNGFFEASAGRLILGKGKVKVVDEVPNNLEKILQKIPEKDYFAIKEASVHNVNSDTLILGKYTPTITNGVKDWSTPGPDSYVVIARTEQATYFDLGSNWDSIKSKYSLIDDEMFEAFNIPVLDDAISAGKQIKFTHDPRTSGGFLQQEWEYLQNTHGYNRLKEIDGVWYAK